MKAFFASATVLALLLAFNVAADDTKLKTVEGVPHTACYGTTVNFVDTPVQAAKLAAEQNKLVFVLHVAGYFEDPNFT